MDKENVKNRMKSMIDKYYKLNRTAVSEDSNILVKYLADRLNIEPRSVKSGEECLTWTIPYSWTVNCGYLADKNNNIIIDFKDNPLHLWSNSCKFVGKISREDLESHLLYSKENPLYIPFHYRNQYNMAIDSWGFSLCYNDYKDLTDDEYFVNIDTVLDNSIPMDYIDYEIKGESEKTIIFCAHTCHPALVTDGLSCVSVLMELIELLKLQKNKYTYRFVFAAEYYAGAAFLANTSDEEISNIKYGVFLDMLGNNKPVGFQTSFQANTNIDFITENVLFNTFDDTFKVPYRQLWGNDEMFYNGPGFNIPMVGIGGDKFREYHFHVDDNKNVNYDDLLTSIDFLMDIVNSFEKNKVPKLLYRGPLYQSKYGIYIDPKVDPKGYANIESLQILTDGKTSFVEMAKKLNVSIKFVIHFFEVLKEKGLVEFIDDESKF